jgi:4-hydroxy-2-oxoheptanedioate aldolase
VGNDGGLKQRIRSGEPLAIAWAALSMDRNDLSDVLSGEAWDLVFVDAQHAAFAEADLVEFCRTVDDIGVPALLRIRHPRLAYLAGNYADLGPLGILVPLVEEQATVADAIEGFYYPPLGKRSWGPTHAYGREGITDREAYAHWWNTHGILALQIETVDAVLNVRSLVRPGVDLLLFGSNDLSFSLAAHADASLHSMEACWAYVRDHTANTGVRVAAGMLPYGRFAATVGDAGVG